MRNILPAVAILALLASCSGGSKKVVIEASGKVTVNGNTVNLEPGSQHNEVPFVPSADSISVVSPSGTKGFSVKENGLYVLNLKTDTIAGAYQPVGTDNSQQVISQENLKQRIDSLYQLMMGTNVSAKSRNYNLPPFTIARITDNTDAEVIGPFLKVPGSFDPSKKHEIYKFYTNKEIMEILMKSSKMAQ